jgi:hypothetical protein
MEFTNHIVRLNGLMTLTTKTSLSAFVQYNTAIDGVIGNIRFATTRATAMIFTWFMMNG